MQRRRQEHCEAQAAVNLSELLDQTTRRVELSKMASDNGKQMLDESRRLEEKFRKEAERRRREQQELQKQQLLEIRQAENELMKKAKAMRKGSTANESERSSSSHAGGSETEKKWKRGFFATLFGR